MAGNDAVWQERRLEEILFSSLDPVTKVERITKLGFDPEVAEEIVERHTIGSQAPVYYERVELEPVKEGLDRDKLRERLMKEDWGYSWYMSDYCTSKEDEEFTERDGLAKIEKLIDDIIKMAEES